MLGADYVKRATAENNTVNTEITELHNPFIKFLRDQGIEYIRARSDQRSTIEKGWVDFSVESPCAASLLIEFKMGKKQLDPAQARVHTRLKARGFTPHVCRSVEDAVELVQQWKSGMGRGAAIPPTIDGKPEFITKFQTRFRLQPDGSYSPYAPAN